MTLSTSSMPRSAKPLDPPPRPGGLWGRRLLTGLLGIMLLVLTVLDLLWRQLASDGRGSALAGGLPRYLSRLLLLPVLRRLALAGLGLGLVVFFFWLFD